MPSEKSRTARFEFLFSRYEHELRRFLGAYLPNKTDVDDCAQEAFLNIWKQERRGILREDARGYLFTTALNVVRDYWRRDRAKHYRDHIELSEDLETVRTTSAEKALAEREAVRMIESQLGKLRPSTQAVFLLHHVEHMTCEEIATRLNISTRTVERELARALDFCRSTLGDVMKDLLE